MVPPVDQVPKFRRYHVRGVLDPITMAGQHLFEAIVRELAIEALQPGGSRPIVAAIPTSASPASTRGGINNIVVMSS